MTVEISETVKFSSGLEVNTTIYREIIINERLHNLSLNYSRQYHY